MGKKQCRSVTSRDDQWSRHADPESVHCACQSVPGLCPGKAWRCSHFRVACLSLLATTTSRAPDSLNPNQSCKPFSTCRTALPSQRLILDLVLVPTIDLTMWVEPCIPTQDGLASVTRGNVACNFGFPTRLGLSIVVEMALASAIATMSLISYIVVSLSLRNILTANARADRLFSIRIQRNGFAGGRHNVAFPTRARGSLSPGPHTCFSILPRFSASTS